MNAPAGSRFALIVSLTSVLFATALPVVTSTPASADVNLGLDLGSAEQQLFNLTNADRAQNGLGGLALNPTLASIARGAPHDVCGTGQTLHGRSQDMVERGFFSHTIPPCGSFIWPVIRSYGIQMSNYGENIGLDTFDAVTNNVPQINSGFMRSPGHRANILGDFNSVGIGVYTGTGPFNYLGYTYAPVVIFTEVFAKVSGAAPPPPPPPPRPQPLVHTAAPPPPPPPPTAAPDPTPSPTEDPSPTPDASPDPLALATTPDPGASSAPTAVPAAPAGGQHGIQVGWESIAALGLSALLAGAALIPRRRRAGRARR